MKRFCERLQAARKAAGFSSQEKFAEAIGIKRTNYQPFEKGLKLPDPDVTIPKIANGLHLPIEVVMAWYRLDGADKPQKIAVLKELYADPELESVILELHPGRME